MKSLGATRTLAAVGLALTLSGTAVAALAAAAPAGGPFGTGNAPIDISADELEVRDAENRAIWRGSVEAIQGQNRLSAPQLSIFYAGRGGGGTPVPGGQGGQIQKMEAEGPVYYITPQQNARGDHAVYDAASSTVTMTGNVVLTQGKNVVQGQRLVIDTTTNKATLISDARGRGASGRVRGVFYPSQAQAQNGAAGAAAPR